jgi:hypothetical protein
LEHKQQIEKEKLEKERPEKERLEELETIYKDRKELQQKQIRIIMKRRAQRKSELLRKEAQTLGAQLLLQQ